MPHISRKANRLLHALPDEEFRRVARVLTRVTLARGAVLTEPGRPFDYVYFPIGAIVSAVVGLADGGTVEGLT
jgi:CRP-like cAMP-binding protein